MRKTQWLQRVAAWGLVLVGLAGCSGGGDRSATATAAAAGTVTISLQAFGDPAELSAYRELIAAYERAHPAHRVEFIPVGKQPDHMAKLTTGFAGGDPPDLFLINFRRVGQFATRGVLQPLGPALAARGKYNEADFYEQALEAFRFDGQLVCAPQNISSLVVYWNKSLFSAGGVAPPQPDWTWETFLAAAKATTRDANGDGRMDQYGLGFEPTLVRLAPFVWQAGGQIVDHLAHPTRFPFDQAETAEALNFVRSWRATHGVTPALLDNKSEDHETRFARGAMGMILHSRRYTATLRTLKELDWDVAPLPRHRHAATVLHADAYCMAKSSPHQDVALSFVEFALGAEGAGIIARSGRTVPARKSVAAGPDFLDPTQKPASAQVFLDSIAHIRRTPNIDTWNEIETRVDPHIEEWYFADPPGTEPLVDEVNEAARGLLKDPDGI